MSENEYNYACADTVSDSEGYKMENVSHSDMRRVEIVKACRALYQKMNFKEITIKEISEYTSFSRPSIYNYFATKESIFLEIFREEYVFWCDDMDDIIKKYKKLSVKDFASKLAQTLENRPVLLKLLSMNLYDLEENCSLEDLTAFKQEYKRALNTVSKLLKTYFPQMTGSNVDRFIYIFFPFMFGLYPYANVTQKQKDAMNAAGLKFPTQRVYDFTYQAIFSLLNNQGGKNE